MRRCMMCKNQEAITAWQPFGPAENCRNGDAFTALGSHHRGFPVLTICGDCQGEIQNGEHIGFTYKGEGYRVVGELPPEKSTSLYKGTTFEDIKIDLFEALINAGYSESEASKVINIQSSVIKQYAEELDETRDQLAQASEAHYFQK